MKKTNLSNTTKTLLIVCPIIWLLWLFVCHNNARIVNKCESSTQERIGTLDIKKPN